MQLVSPIEIVMMKDWFGDAPTATWGWSGADETGRHTVVAFFAKDSGPNLGDMALCWAYAYVAPGTEQEPVRWTRGWIPLSSVSQVETALNHWVPVKITGLNLVITVSQEK